MRTAPRTLVWMSTVTAQRWRWEPGRVRADVEVEVLRVANQQHATIDGPIHLSVTRDDMLPDGVLKVVASCPVTAHLPGRPPAMAVS